MSTKNPRVNVTLDEESYKTLTYMAKREKVSLSQKVKECVFRTLEEVEDRYLSKVADERIASLNKKETLRHKDIF